MNKLINKLISPPNSPRYITIENGTPEHRIAIEWLRWAGTEGTTHVYTDAGIESVWTEFIRRIES